MRVQDGGSLRPTYTMMTTAANGAVAAGDVFCAHAGYDHLAQSGAIVFALANASSGLTQIVGVAAEMLPEKDLLHGAADLIKTGGFILQASVSPIAGAAVVAFGMLFDVLAGRCVD